MLPVPARCEWSSGNLLSGRRDFKSISTRLLAANSGKARPHRVSEILDRFPLVKASKMPPLGESKHGTVELQRNIDMRAVFGAIRASQQLLGVREPPELTIEAKMDPQHAAVEQQGRVLAL